MYARARTPRPLGGGPLNVVIIGNSVAGANGGITNTPAVALAANLTAAGRTFNVFDDSVGNTDTPYWANSLRITSVDSRYVATAGWLNIAILLETSDNCDDTLGAAGNSLSLTDPTAAGLSDYNSHVSWAVALKAAHAAWLPVVVCPPDVVEPSTYASAGDNTNYRTARDHSNDLKVADATNFYRVINMRARSEFSSPWSLTYYQDGGNGQRIHVTETGGQLMGLLNYQGIT